MIEDVQEKHVGKWRQDEINVTYTYYCQSTLDVD